MKKLFFIACFAFGLTAYGQNALDEMIAAEKSFAAYAVANNTVDAFLKFMDTSAVMFRDGEPYSAYADWQKREKQPGILNWWPQYAELASSGDFGYTCGSWTFHPDSVKGPFTARGFFFTIWKKNKAGEWKFILDVGMDTKVINISRDVLKMTDTKTAGTLQSLKDAEEAYQRTYKKDEPKAKRDFMTGTTILASASGRFFQRKDEINLPIPSTKGGGFFDFTYLGSGLAPSGDLGYTYGSFTHPLTTKKETYLRIWRHEPSGWKIALQMIRDLPVSRTNDRPPSN